MLALLLMALSFFGSNPAIEEVNLTECDCVLFAPAKPVVVCVQGVGAGCGSAEEPEIIIVKE